jgi:hypothetical protein
MMIPTTGGPFGLTLGLTFGFETAAALGFGTGALFLAGMVRGFWI